MKRMFVGLAVLAGGCDVNTHAVSLTKPDAAAVDAAIEEFARLSPPMKTGRWTVSTAPMDVELKGLPTGTADEIRERFKSMNSQAKCLSDISQAVSSLKTTVDVWLQTGCTMERLNVDPGKLTFDLTCDSDGLWRSVKVRALVGSDRFATQKIEEHGRDADHLDGRRANEYEGIHEGDCRGDEVTANPFLWNDQR